MRVLGTMSGTSLDGVDAAVLETDGETVTGFGPTAYRPYGEDERAILRTALGAWPEEPRAEDAARVVEAAHAELLAGFDPVDLIGFHGQTLAHNPSGRGTHQAGSGARLAAALRVPVAWDFRSADVAAGGQGAPLAPFYHHALARFLGLDAPVVFLNIGGVANVTWIDPADPAPETACRAFDCGPGNAPMDDFACTALGLARDDGGALALSGTADADRLASFGADPFFALPPPKSLDRAAPAPDVTGLDARNALATLAAAVALGVARAFDHFPAAPARVLVCGGGRHNRAIMTELSTRLPCPVAPIEEAGLDGDMIEAQAFAFLAARVARSLPLSAPGTTGAPRAVAGGRISPPPD